MEKLFVLVYKDGAQHIFTEEQTRTYPIVLAWLLGSLVGLFFGLLEYLHLGALNTSLIVIASLGTLKGLACMQQTHLVAYMVITLLLFGICGTIRGLLMVPDFFRISRELKVFFVVLLSGVAGMFVYKYTRVAYSEDQRKHWLERQEPERSLSPHRHESRMDLLYWSLSSMCYVLRELLPDVMKGASPILRNHWVPSDFPGVPLYTGFVIQDFLESGLVYPPIWEDFQVQAHPDCIRILNRSLKRIKCVLYCWEDLSLWIPMGGIGGKGVICINSFSEGLYFLRPPFRGGQLKIFTESIMDIQLIYYEVAQKGGVYIFRDLQKSVRYEPLPDCPDYTDESSMDDWSPLSETSMATPQPLGMKRSMSSQGLVRPEDGLQARSISFHYGDIHQSRPLKPLDLGFSGITLRNELVADIQVSFFLMNDFFQLLLIRDNHTHIFQSPRLIRSHEESIFHFQKYTHTRAFLMRLRIASNPPLDLAEAQVVRGARYVVFPPVI